MSDPPAPIPATAPVPTGDIACSMSAALLARVEASGGETAVADLLERSGVRHDADYLRTLSNWISLPDALALWDAGTAITHHPSLARATGEDSAELFNGSPLAALLRSIGSPEAVMGNMHLTCTKFSTATAITPLEARPGYAVVDAVATNGGPMRRHMCDWTQGLIAAITANFGLPFATVRHDACAVHGADVCRYEVTWDIGESDAAVPAPVGDDASVRALLAATQERLRGVFDTAADLIAAGDVDDILARIAERAAMEVRAPRHLLAVRLTADGPLHLHATGLTPAEERQMAETLLSDTPAPEPDAWLVAPVRSSRRDYGRLVAAYPGSGSFLPQERELLEVYARYAASALDGAAALHEAQARSAQSGALLDLARALSIAGTSAEVARRLADVVPAVVDCDRVAVYTWNGAELELEAWTDSQDETDLSRPRFPTTPDPGTILAGWLTSPAPEPVFLDTVHSSDSEVRTLQDYGYVRTGLVPLFAAGELQGGLAVSVRDRAERLDPTPDLLDRLSGVSAQAGTALQNGRLLDLITFQARHDGLTGLVNRTELTEQLGAAVTRAGTAGHEACLFYLDLDGFKPVNDTLGHVAGDALLTAVGERLTRCVREHDIVARLGGDEFAVLIPDSARQDLDDLAERLQGAFREPFALDGKQCSVTCSLGRAVYPRDAPDAAALLHEADAAMFAHKRERRAGRPAPALVV